MDAVPENRSSSSSDPLAALALEFGARVHEETLDGIPVLSVERDGWLDCAKHLRADEGLSYELLLDVTAVDWPKRRPRFELVYHLWSLRRNHVLRVKVGVPEEDAVCDSVVPIWKTADWQEREVFDMFGIEFRGHPDLRRILMPDGYPWHPLRKDFPVEGIDNGYCYRQEGGVLMTNHVEVDLPAGQDPTPRDLSHGDPEGFTDRAEELE